MEDDHEDSKSDEPSLLQSMQEYIIESHTQGSLSLIALLITVVYNLMVFSYPNGYDFYFTFPLIGLGIGFFSSFWKTSNKFSFYAGVFFVFISLVFDLMVSVSYMWGMFDDLSSVPTLILDLIGVMSLLIWLYQLDMQNKFNASN